MMNRRHGRHVVALMGRLGNQLFQYSFARWLEQETGTPVLFDVSMLRPDGVGGNDCFRREIELRTLGVTRHLPAYGGRMGPVAGWARRIVGPPHIQLDGTPLGDPQELERPSWWFGYWQQLRFAGAAADELGSLLIGDRGPVREREPQVVVHVRRGDYVGLEAALAPAWYRAAVGLALDSLGASAEVVVVSDDQAWCGRELHLGVPFRLGGSADPLQDFKLMAQAECLVASASTFSWWAGFLGRGRVIFPEGRMLPETPSAWMALTV